MLYFVYKQNTTNQRTPDEFFAVTEPKKDANGYYKCTRQKVNIPTKSGVSGLLNINNFVEFNGLTNMIVPYTKTGRLYSTEKLDCTDTISTLKYEFYISNKYNYTTILDQIGNKSELTKILKCMNSTNNWNDIYNVNEIEKNVKLFMNSKIDIKDEVNFLNVLKLNSTYELWYSKHVKGNWSAKVVIKYSEKNYNEIMYKNYTLEGTIDNNGKFTLTKNSRKEMHSSENTIILKEFYIEMTLNTTDTLLCDKNNWEIGAIQDEKNKNKYCFYSNGKFGAYTLSMYGTKAMYPLDYFKSGFPCYTDQNAGKVHDCSKHGGETGSSTVKPNATPVETSKDLLYSFDGDASNYVGKAVKNLQFGKTGEYKDGVATVPYVMIELRSTSNPNSKDFYNLSIPANSFVSLVHERNLQDQYNTFKLQLFDKDAMQVEAKLLLGFRAITFYYTDFVTTSKRFRGEILNYQTVITGKGLMLTLEGYTSNLQLYTAQDSIPWSLFDEVDDIAFFYWTNKKGEYHGPVRVVTNNLNLLDTTESYWDKLKYTSSTGVMLPATVLKKQNSKIFDKIYNKKEIVYSLKDKDGNFVTFDKLYENSPDDKKDLFRPYPEIFSLEKYNKNILDGLREFNFTRLDEFFDSRPSNIVILICIIMGWKVRKENFVKTRQAKIPDQVNESYLEYIERKLVPISESVTGDTQFVFWFDDEGYPHYSPMLGTNKPKKSLYFNSGERKDSYPLIGFTASTNGAVLMQVDATKTISSVNIYTGEEYDLSQVYDSTNPLLTENIHQTEEWYATNRIINEGKDTNLINFQNVSTIPSEEDLRKQLVYRYGTVAKYSYNASLEVYACADISPGDTVAIYIYIDDGERTDDPVSTKEKVGEIKLSDIPLAYQIANGMSNGLIGDPVIMNVTKDKGNLTMHHSSGTYIVQKITDTISGGRYISTMNVMKLDSELLDSVGNSIGTNDTYDKNGIEFKPIEIEQPNEGTNVSVNPNSYEMYNILKVKNQ